MDKLLTLKEVEKILNVSKSTLQRWDREGKLVAERTRGGHRRYKESEINTLLGERNYIELSTEDSSIMISGWENPRF